jgi:type I restriction enzyme R subunit
VPIYYEARLAPLALRDDLQAVLDDEFEQITEGEEEAARESKKSKWTALEAVVGAEERLQRIAADLVQHFEQRQEIMEGKGMIVAMSRRIAVDLYAQIIKLRPAWHSDRDEEGAIKVVMTGSAGDPAAYQPHVRSKARRKALAERFKDPADPLRLVIVRDMWLTGFDAPVLHTMYIDKPMRGHGLMQTIARVNRVYKDKPGGLIVDYLGIAADLKEAMVTYSVRDGRGAYGGFTEEDPIFTIETAVHLLQTNRRRVQNFFLGQHAFDYGRFFDGTPAQRLALIPAAMEHILAQPDGKKRYMDAVTSLSQAFALVMPHETAVDMRDEVAFFQAVRAGFAKYTAVGARSQAEIDGAIKQLVSSAVSSGDVVDIFAAAGFTAPDISILDDDFLLEVQNLPQRNLALELLRRLIDDEIKARAGRNTVQSRKFKERLQETLDRYNARSLTTTEVIDELIAMAKEMREANQRGEALGLSDDELAFYDALAENESAVQVLGDKQLAFIAHELLQTVRQNATIDWTVRQSARARIKVMVKRLLKKYGYPPDLQEKATDTVLQQAELLAAHWVSA